MLSPILMYCHFSRIYVATLVRVKYRDDPYNSEFFWTPCRELRGCSIKSRKNGLLRQCKIIPKIASENHTVPKVHILSKNPFWQITFLVTLLVVLLWVKIWIYDKKNYQKSLFRVTYFLQIRVSWILQISKIQSKYSQNLLFRTKIGLLR